jgi:hypothetical protein
MQLLEKQKRLYYEKTIDNFQQRQINAVEDHWHDTLKRIIACVRYVAEHNHTFRTTSSKVYSCSNGKFCSLTDMISKFDTLMAEN